MKEMTIFSVFHDKKKTTTLFKEMADAPAPTGRPPHRGGDQLQADHPHGLGPPAHQLYRPR